MKGFTLIELLAVIVILAIILLIAVPVISNLIGGVKKNSFEYSTKLIIKAAEQDYMARKINGDNREVIYTFEDYSQTTTPIDINNLGFSGTGPKNGYIVVSSAGTIEIHATDGNYYIETDASGKVREAVTYDSATHDTLLIAEGGLWTGPFTFEVTIPAGGDTFSFGSVDPNLTINWGDGAEETVTYSGADFIPHAYAEGVYNVSVTGTTSHLAFCNVFAYEAAEFGCYATIDYLTDILTPIPVSMGITSANTMFANTDVVSFTRADFFDQASAYITDMAYMFTDATVFNQPIGNWDTSNVTDMRYMFAYAGDFNQPINTFNTTNVTRMDYMFSGASSFNQPIDNFNTSNVTRMQGMFQDTDSFNQPIGNWDTSSVITMESMFDTAVAFNQNLSSWCVTLNATEPDAFRTGATSWALPKPIWGTCP